MRTICFVAFLISTIAHGQRVCKGYLNFQLADTDGAIVTGNELSKNNEFELYLQFGEGSVNQAFDVDDSNHIITEVHNTVPNGCDHWNILILHHEDSMHVYFPLMLSNPRFPPYDTLALDVIIDFQPGKYLLVMNEFQFYETGEPKTHQMISFDEKQPFLFEQQVSFSIIRERMRLFLKSDFFINREPGDDN